MTTKVKKMKLYVPLSKGKLILAVRARKCLWDYKSPSYKNNHFRQQQWKEVMLELKLEPTHQNIVYCSKKFSAMRYAYQQWLGSDTEKEFHYAKQMEFLIEYVKPRLGQSKKYWEIKQKQLNSDDVYNSEEDLSHDITYIPCSSGSAVNDNEASGSDVAQNKPAAAPIPVQSTSAVALSPPVDNEKNFTIKLTDTHQIFGDYVADEMRGMNASKCRRLKLAIQRAILELEEEEETDEPQQPPRPVPSSTPVHVVSGELSAADFTIEVKEEQQDLYL